MTSIHGVHPYPCKFPADVARRHVMAGAVVLDPFCGSGTTLVEAARRGCRAVGIDCNPIATLISRFKLLEGDELFLADARQRLKEFDAGLERGIARGSHALHDFEGRDHWFSHRAQREVAYILAFIQRTESPDVALWLRVALSAILTRVSHQDGETRYARVERALEPRETLDLFRERAARALDLLLERGFVHSSHAVLQADVRRGIPLKSGSIDQIVTSPPYANTMDYYLYHKQRMNVLGYRFKPVQRVEIGSRWEFSSLKARAAKWESDYAFVLEEFRRVLRRSGSALVVIGDSQIAGELVDSADLTRRAARQVGLDCDVLESVSLTGRSRSFNAKFQRPNKREHVILLTRRR